MIVYTAIFGNYDTLRDPLFESNNIEYICFTDNENIKSKIWDVMIVERELSPRREARRYKILSHKYIDSKKSLWVDGCILLHTNPLDYICDFNYDFMLTKHWRNCLYEEAKRVVSIGKADREIVRIQIERYKNEEFPKDIGLVDTTVLFRNMTPEIRKVENDWWKELSQGSRRDQLSFNYVAWKNDLDYGLFNWRKIGTRKPHRK